MRTRFVLPDFLNLGVGPFAPRGAMGVAPRAAMLPAGTIGQVFSFVRVNRSPQLVNTYLLPLTGMVQGQAFSNAPTNPLSPNPYSG